MRALNLIALPVFITLMLGLSLMNAYAAERCTAPSDLPKGTMIILGKGGNDTMVLPGLKIKLSVYMNGCGGLNTAVFPTASHEFFRVSVSPSGLITAIDQHATGSAYMLENFKNYRFGRYLYEIKDGKFVRIEPPPIVLNGTAGDDTIQLPPFTSQAKINVDGQGGQNVLVFPKYVGVGFLKFTFYGDYFTAQDIHATGALVTIRNVQKLKIYGQLYTVYSSYIEKDGVVSTTDTFAPSVPGDVKANAISSSQVDLTWKASSDNVAVTGYKIFRNRSFVGKSTTTAFSDKGLMGATTYEYTLAAYDAVGNESSLSAPVVVATAEPDDNQAPLAPSGLIAKVITSNQIDLAWNASTDNIAVVGYKILRDGVQIATRTTLDFSDPDLLPKTTYTYSILAFDKAGNTSLPSNTLNVTTLALKDTVAPSIPLGLKAEVTSYDRVQLIWESSTDDNAVAGYKIIRNGGVVGTTTSLNYEDKGLSELTAYEYRVSAFDLSGNTSESSLAVNVTTIAKPKDTLAPTTPLDLTAKAVSSTQIDLSWSASSDNVAVTGYKILRDGIQVATSTGAAYSDKALEASKSYAYSVIAFDAAGNDSSTSIVVTATTLATTPCIIPTGLPADTKIILGTDKNDKITLPPLGVGTKSYVDGCGGEDIALMPADYGWYEFKVAGGVVDAVDTHATGTRATIKNVQILQFGTAQYKVEATGLSPLGTTGTTDTTTVVVTPPSLLNPPVALPDGNTMVISNQSGQDLSNYPLQFARPFKPAEIMNYPQVMINGVEVFTQADVKTRFPDGSVKHSVISVILPLVPAKGSLVLSFKNQLTGNNTPLTPAAMLSSDFDFEAQLSITNSGRTVSASARKMLQDGNYTVWTSGPINTTIILVDHINRFYDMGFDSYRSIRPIFHASFWPLTKQVRVRFIGENSNIPTLQDVNYALSLKLGLALPREVYANPSVNHYLSTRWTKEFWINGAPEIKVNVDHNIKYLASTKSFPNFDPTAKSRIGEPDVQARYAYWSAFMRPVGGLLLQVSPQEIDTLIPKPASTPCTAPTTLPSGTQIIMGTAGDDVLQQPVLTAGARIYVDGCGGKNIFEYTPAVLKFAVSDGDVINIIDDHATGSRITLVNIHAIKSRSSLFKRDLYEEGLMTKYMPTTGGRAEIGIVTDWDAAWLYTGDWRLGDIAKGLAELALAWPLHTREGDPALKYDRAKTIPAIGKPVSVPAHPTVWYPDNGGSYAAFALPVPRLPASGWVPDAAHQPDMFTTQYALRGDYFFLEQMQMWAAAQAIAFPPGGYGRGEPGYMGITDQIRGNAWSFRNRVNAAFFSPDGTPEKEYFNTAVNDAITLWEGERNITSSAFVTSPQWIFGKNKKLNLSPLHFWLPASSSLGYKDATWQHYFITTSLGIAKEKGFATSGLLSWIAPLTNAQFTDPGYDPRFGSFFQTPYMKPDGSAYYTSWAEIQLAMDPVEKAALVADYPREYSTHEVAAAALTYDEPGGKAAWDWLELNVRSKTDHKTFLQRNLVPRSDATPLPPS